MTTVPTACVLLIGNELLSGRTQDLNLAFFGARANEAGVRVMQARVIPDVEEVIVAALNECRAAFDYVFTSGGIGPTHDDITSAAVARAFGVPLVRHPEAVRLLTAHLGAEKLNEARLKMADVPEGAELIANPVSAAPGFRIENVFVTAGVPKICHAMWDDIRPRLNGGAPMASETIVCNLREGDYAADLAAIQAAHPAVEIGSYPNFRDGRIHTSLVGRSHDPAALASAALAIAAMVERLGGERYP